MENSREVELTASEMPELAAEVLKVVPTGLKAKTEAVFEFVRQELDRLKRVDEARKNPPDPIIKVAGKEVDASKGVPLNVGQLKALKKLGTTMNDFGAGMSDEHLCNVAQVVLQRADSTLTLAEFEQLDIRDVGRVSRVMNHATFLAAADDRPT